MRFLLLSLIFTCQIFAQPCHILLVRHGETEALANRLFQGQLDSDLNEKGKKQAQEVVQQLDGMAIDAIYSSPLRRTVDSAKPLAEKRQLSIITYPELKERCYGYVEGSAVQDHTHLPTFTPYFHPQKEEDLTVRLVEDAETFQEAITRFSAILKKIATDHPGQTVVVFTHGGVTRGLKILITGSFEQRGPGTGEITHLDVTPDTLELRAEHPQEFLMGA